MSFWEWFSVKFHRHQWEIAEKIPLNIYDGSYVDHGRVTARGFRYLLQCKICGEIKFKDSL